MSKISSPIFSRSKRTIVAAGLTIIYLLLSLGPLTAGIKHANLFAHSIRVECSGDCNLCGCSPEKRASKTCCCSMKQQQEAQARAHESEDGTADCCKKLPEKKQTFVCSYPCGSDQQIDLTAADESEVIPSHFREGFSLSPIETTFTTTAHLLASRHGDPPDPPPKLV
ncbi:MAG: hypothetical protein M0T70_14505 [Geobacteraceae bacterium]|nr:hypothetical protein [Geobacteraceae bacterium]